jgi:hypothetical protein
MHAASLTAIGKFNGNGAVERRTADYYGMYASTTLFLRDDIIFIQTTSYKVLNGNDANMQREQLCSREVNSINIFK